MGVFKKLTKMPYFCNLMVKKSVIYIEILILMI